MPGDRCAAYLQCGQRRFERDWILRGGFDGDALLVDVDQRI
jgi:hypothetical protein